MNAWYLPFILQGVSMFVDEFYFHEKRGLGKWERIGHPLDTVTVLACFAYLIWGSPSEMIYVSLCAVSCLFITKDEFVHRRNCSPMEHWLHALLFLLHPICFTAAFMLWQQNDLIALKVQFSIVFIFLIYQTLRWSKKWRMQA